ncbi:MAG TPA: lysylphosphatidylglycerol synthase transmembrane domain-containing protein [Solirubrobacteraceae bacterium]|nr:lysylphosphatidylglycerol synthase transmembrane domain-containing protein [Solirubrobacteraceae bacterium]
MATTTRTRPGTSVRAPAGKGDCESRRRPSPPLPPEAPSQGVAPEPEAVETPDAEAVDTPQAEAVDSRNLRRRLIGLGIAAIAVSSLLLAVPALNKALTDIGRMRAGWIAAAVALEIASCVGFVLVFRAFFDRVPGPLARRVAWTESGSGALLPGGGVTGYALGGVLLNEAGLDRRRIVVLSGGLFWLTSFVNAVAVAVGTLLLVSGASHGPHDFLRLGLPLIAAAVALGVVLFLALRARNARHGWQKALGEGVEEAARSALHPSWRLLGAIGYLGFDIAVLWCTFRALGASPSVGALILGYLVGYLGTLIPIPGGIGVLEGGLAGALVLYGTPATTTIAAVLVYHAIAFWVPSLGGLFAYFQLRRPLGRPRAMPIRRHAPVSQS